MKQPVSRVRAGAWWACIAAGVCAAGAATGVTLGGAWAQQPEEAAGGSSPTGAAPAQPGGQPSGQPPATEPVPPSPQEEVGAGADDRDLGPRPQRGDAASDQIDMPFDEHKSAQNVVLENEMTPQLERSVQRGMSWLARQQNADGSFGDDRWGRSVAITALSCIAFMADGHLPGRGAYGEVVQKGLESVLESCNESGLIAGDATQAPMYGHGFAALFLAEIYGMTAGGPDTALAGRVHDALVRSVRLIQSTQNSEGGWRYNPIPNDADVSVTICQVMALRAARNAGLEVPKETIDRAVEYVRKCQNRDGGFMYQLNGGQSAWPRSAAGVATLYYAGIYNDPAIARGIRYLQAFGRNNPAAVSAHYFYGQYYTAQAMYLAGGDAWASWWPMARRELMDSQMDDGHWADSSVDDRYGTAMALIVLQMPKRYMPIFQK